MRQFVGTGESALYRVSVVPTRLLLRGAQNEAGPRLSYAPMLGQCWNQPPAQRKVRYCGRAWLNGGWALVCGLWLGQQLRARGRQCRRRVRADAKLFQLLPKITLSGLRTE